MTNEEFAAVRAGEGRTLPDAMPIDYILDTEWYCDEFKRELGEEPWQHASADDYTLDDLIDMYEWTTCPLCINPEYPLVPAGVWSRQVEQAGDELDCLTEKHAGQAIIPDDVNNYEWHATAAELRGLWETYPHARWWFEKYAIDGRFTIHVVNA